jgi:hypothetical protein
MPLWPAVRRARWVAPFPGWKAILVWLSGLRIPTEVALKFNGGAEIGFRYRLRQGDVTGDK